MAIKTFEELKQLAIQIRDEKTNKQNTATRIGTQMLEHLNKLEQDYYDKTATDEELKQRDEKLTELSSQTGNKIDYDELSIQEIEKLLSLSDENGNIAFYVDKEGYLRAKTKESEAIERLTNNEIENEDGKFPFSFSDEKGNILFYLDHNGFFHANNEKKFEAENGKYLLSFSDENGNMAFYVDENGYFHVKSKLFGKRLSILADSISTFKGYLADEEYQHYYPAYGIDTVDNTWWMQLINRTGMTLLRNCSWSGSRVCGNSNDNETASAGCSNKRIDDLSDGVNTPDIVIVWIGINDFIMSQYKCGDWDGTKEIPTEGTITVFSEAYALTIKKVMTKYPKCRVFCCTLMDTQVDNEFTHLSNPTVYPSKNEANSETVYMFNSAIKKIALSLGAGIIDMHACGINFFNVMQYTGDGLHPNESGALLCSYKAESDLLSQYL